VNETVTCGASSDERGEKNDDDGEHEEHARKWIPEDVCKVFFPPRGI
jgi:hypothetical protein